MHTNQTNHKPPQLGFWIFVVVVCLAAIAMGLAIHFGLSTTTPITPTATITPTPTITITPTPPIFQLVDRLTGLEMKESIGTKFRYYTATDPTHGYITYGAFTDLLSIVDGDKLRIDIGTNSGPRRSIRLESLFTFDTGLLVIDVEHIPSDLSNWPAFWTVGEVESPSTWALSGELDIIEQVNDSNVNQSTLHTNTHPGGIPCEMAEGLGFIERKCYATSGDKTCGYNSSDYCSYEGCGKQMIANTFGSVFNSTLGGTFAMLLPANGQITIWFWARDKIVPDFAGVTSTAFENVTDSIAFTACPGSFSQQRVIINTDICGSFAGSPHPPEWTNEAGCEAYVDSHTFTNAYWVIRSLELYSIV